MPDPFLHDHPEFTDLIRTVAAEQGIDPYLAEKDYWIMHCLFGLKQAGYDFQLKGGTSLSKGFGIIDRFSEDIDIHISPPKDMDVKTLKNQDKEQHRQSRKDFYDYLAQTITIQGILRAERDTLFDGIPKYFSGGIRLFYQAHFASDGTAKDGVLLEAGFDDVAPNHAVDISSWALDFAIERNVAVLDNRARDILCYDPGYTLVEKLQTIATKYRKQQEQGGFPENFMRHYYDVYCLLQNKSVLEFIGTPAYESHKEKRFPKADLKVPLYENEAFLLRDKNTYALYKQEYEKRRGLYYRGQPAFEDVLGIIRDHIKKL